MAATRPPVWLASLRQSPAGCPQLHYRQPRFGRNRQNVRRSSGRVFRMPLGRRGVVFSGRVREKPATRDRASTKRLDTANRVRKDLPSSKLDRKRNAEGRNARVAPRETAHTANRALRMTRSATSINSDYRRRPLGTIPGGTQHRVLAESTQYSPC
jgi:hypothetical protein